MQKAGAAAGGTANQSCDTIESISFWVCSCRLLSSCADLMMRFAMDMAALQKAEDADGGDIRKGRGGGGGEGKH